MAEFNPQIRDTGVPDMTNASRGTGVNRAFESLFEGLSQTAENVAKIKDTATQYDIQDKATDMFDDVNREFGLDAPTGMTDSLDQIQVLKNAVDQGKLSEVNYYGRLATLSKQLRTKYPGYESIVDRTIQSVTGTRPANAYRDAILSEIRSAQSGAAAEARHDRSFLEKEAGKIALLFPDYANNPSKYSVEELRQGVAEFDAEKEGIEAQTRRLKFETDKGNYNEKQFKKNIDKDFSMITQTFLNSVTGANSTSYEEKLNTLAASGGSPQELREFAQTMAQAETALRQKLIDRGNKQYAGYMSAKDINTAVDNAMYPLTKAKEAVLGGNYKLADQYATINKAIKDKSMNDLFQDPDVRIGAGMDAISNQLGAEWFQQKSDDIFGRVQDSSLEKVANEVTGRVLSGDTELLKQTVLHGNSTATKATLNKTVDALLDENITPDGVHNIIDSLFGPKAVDWMSKGIVDTDDRKAFYKKILDPRITRAVFSKGSPEDQKTYFDWAVDKAAGIPEFRGAAGDVNTLRSYGAEVTFDPKTMKFSVDIPKEAFSGKNPFLPTNPFRDTALSGASKTISAINEVMAVMNPIVENSGVDKEQAALSFVKAMAIQIDGTDPEAGGDSAKKDKGFWSWMYDGLSQPINNQSKETVNETRENLGMVPLEEVALSQEQADEDINFFTARNDTEDSINNEEVIPTGSKWLLYANKGAIRSEPLSKRLTNALGSFIPDMGLSMKVFSGGQEATGSKRTGSHRHDHGNAADVFFYQNGRRLDWANPEDRKIFEEIVRKAKKAGITGIGAGPGYMREGSMHIGFGTPAVWGKGGRGRNAPSWLVNAYNG